MNRKSLNDDEVEGALQYLFGLPEDPDQSDDNLESDEEDVNFSTARLQRILEDLDEPGPANLLLDDVPMQSPSSIHDQLSSPLELIHTSGTMSTADATSAVDTRQRQPPTRRRQPSTNSVACSCLCL